MHRPIPRIHWKARFRRYMARLVEQKWINVGLRTKMGVIVVVGLVGLLTIFSLLGISTAGQVTEQVLNERVALAHLGGNNLDSTIRHIKSMLAAIASQEALLNPYADPQKRALALQTGFELITVSHGGLYLFDQTGKLTGSAAQMETNINWANVAAVKNALTRQQAGLSIVPGDRPWAAMAVPIIKPDTGATVGALAVLLDLTAPDIAPFEHSLDLGHTETLEVVTADGLVLISTRPERVLTTSDQADLLRQLFTAHKVAVKTCVGCTDGDTSTGKVMAFAPMVQAPWGVVVQQDSGEVFAPVNRLKLLTALLGLATVVGALTLVWITTSSVIDPVQLLTEAARRIAGGDLTTPVCCQRGDEIGELAESFDAMRARLKDSIDEIQAWNQELDARVQERTRAALAAQLEAQAARDDLRAIIDGLSDELIVIGLDRHIRLANKAAANGLMTTDEAAGLPCYQLFHRGHQCNPPDCVCPFPIVLETGEPVKVTHTVDDSKNGKKRYLDIVASPMRDHTGQINRVIELRRDVTDEKQMEESLVRRNQQLSILNAIATTVNQSLDIEDILGQALDEVLQLTGVDVGAIFLQQEQLGNLQLLAHRGLSEEAAHLASRMGMLDGSCGGVMEAGQVIVVPDLSRYRGRRAASLQRERLTTLVHVPLAAKGCILGSICVGTRNQRDFNAEEQEMLTAIGSQIAVAIENARLYAEVQHKEHLRGQILNKLISAQEEERKRIARELHDDTSQALAALLFAVEEGLEMDNLEEIRDKLSGMKELTMHTMEEIYKLIYDLRPTMLDHLGLVPALRSFAQSRLEPAGVRVTIQEASAPCRLPPEVETALFRVVQEVITNIARHASARNVSIIFQFENDMAMVSVEDDGLGFDMVEVTHSPNPQRGLGLMGMLERVELLGGQMEIDTAPGYGTQIHIQVPTGLGQKSTPPPLTPDKEGLAYA